MNIKTLPISEARRKIFDIAEDIQIPGTHYILTERGISKVVVLSADEYDSWVETMEVMRDFPNLKKDIQEAENEYKRGEYITLEKLLAKDGYVKAIKNHVISSGSHKKSSKGTRKNRS